MKIQSLKCWLVLFALALGLGQKNQAFGQSCSISFMGPSGNVLTSFIQIYPNYPNSDAYFHTLVQDTSEPLPIGTYLTWCVDADTLIDPIQNVGTLYSGVLFPTCDTNLNNEIPPGHTPTSYVSPAVWQQVNYILNHKGAAYNFWDVQVAINDLVGGPAPGPSPPYPPFTQANVQSYLDAASANAASWTPQPCHDVIGAVYVITNQSGSILTSPVQLLLIEIPYCQVTFTKCPTNLALGCNPASIPDIDTNLVSASSCCGNPVTITGSKSESTLNCTGYRLLTYTASDSYGNTATCSQTITWTVDTNAPVVSVPPGGDLGCNPTTTTLPTDASVTALVKATDTCTLKSISVTHGDVFSPCGTTRTFTITAIDGCGNSATKTVVYTWTVDSIKPTITSTPANTNLGCNPATLPMDADVKALVKATDNCTLLSTNVSHLDSTNLCTITRTFTITATDACGNTSTTNVVYTWTVDTTKPVITCPPDITISNNVVPYCTFIPGDYGAVCNGTNASSILNNCFKLLYPGGYAQCGITNSSYWMKFTSFTCIQKFISCSGTPNCLKGNYSNPTTCEAGVFGGQTLCLKLNVDIGDALTAAGFSSGCGDLVLNDSTSPLNGKSIRQILAICNTALGGGNVSSYGCTISSLSTVCSNLNQSFQYCKPSTWCQTHIKVPAITNLTPKVTGYATVVDKCSSTPVLTYSDVTTAGTCSGAYTIARTWVAVDGCGNSNYCTQKITVGVPKATVCVTGPCNVKCGQTGSYTCSVTNTGSTCFSACKVSACGQSFTCPVLNPGQGCSFTFNYKFQSGDVGTYNCNATASCTYSAACSPCTAMDTCSTKVAKY